MTAAFYWSATGRLEVLGTFPSRPSLLDRGQSDAVGDAYVRMQGRGELSVPGDATVPVAPWLVELMKQVEGETIATITADRYKQAELGEAVDKAGIRAPVIWRGQGFRDGGEDCARFRRAAYGGKVRTAPSLLLRSAFADAVCLRDPANNLKLAKTRSTGRIDAVAATVLAVFLGTGANGQPLGVITGAAPLSRLLKNSESTRSCHPKAEKPSVIGWSFQFDGMKWPHAGRFFLPNDSKRPFSAAC